MAAIETTRSTVNISQAQEICGVSRRTIYNWIATKKLSVLRTPGGLVRFYRDELLRLESERAAPAKEIA